MPVEELTPEEKTTVVEWLKRAWESVADDCFLRPDGKIDYKREMSRQEVYEVAADHIEIYSHSKRPRELCLKFYKQPVQVKQELAERAFPHSIYSY